METCQLKEHKMLDAEANCKPEDCWKCGWNKTESFLRHAYIDEHGLENKDGKRCLVLPEIW